MNGNIFSDDWYKVSNLKLSLLHTTDIHKQVLRGKVWYVLHDPFNNKYFKVSEDAYKFLARLTPSRTVEEIWDEYLDRFPDIAPTQDEVITLLSRLHHLNLLYFNNRPNTEHIFDRKENQKQKEMKGKVLSFLFMKVPLVDPENFLKKIRPLIKLIFNVYGFIIWLAVVVYGLKIFFENNEAFFDQTEGMLDPSNLFVLYVSMALLKLFHELGHAMMTKRYGGAVHTMGLMFIIFTPMPYVDASSSWSFKNKWHRILVGSAGMLVDLFFAAIAAVVWVNTGDGLVHSVAFNIMVIGSVSSIVFNGNPLLKFDSYYMLSDYFEIPNLQQRSKEIWYYLGEKYIFRVKSVYPPGHTTKENVLLAIYGALSVTYRFIVAIGMALLVAQQFFILGVFVALSSAYMWLVKPTYAFLKYLFFDPKLARHRKEAIFSSLVVLIIVLIPLVYIPFSDSIRAKGVVHSKEKVNVYAATGGVLKALHIKNGEHVKKGQLLLELENRELFYDYNIIKFQIVESKYYQKIARNDLIADLKPIEKRLETLNKNKKLTEDQIRDLKVYAEKDGIWVDDNLAKYIGSWVLMRTRVGIIVPESSYDFIAVVSQEKAASLFSQDDLKGEVKLYGVTDNTLKVKDISVVPYEQNKLPSAALGWYGGGDIATDPSDPSGLKATEAFFEVRAKIDTNAPAELLKYDRSGVLRIELPDKTLVNQFMDFFSQLLQKRYKL